MIVVGEMRDHDTISAALTAAETGHLVIATMHSPNVAHAFERIVGVFEGSAQRQIIMQLATSLQGIIAQELLPSVDRITRVLAYELLVANSAVRNIIRENNKHMLETSIQTGGKDGMILMDACIYDLYCPRVDHLRHRPQPRPQSRAHGQEALKMDYRLQIRVRLRRSVGRCGPDRLVYLDHGGQIRGSRARDF